MAKRYSAKLNILFPRSRYACWEGIRSSWHLYLVASMGLLIFILTTSCQPLPSSPALPIPTPEISPTSLPLASPTATLQPTLSEEKDFEEHIAFIAWKEADIRGIYTINSDGTDLTCVASDSGIGSDVTWAPDYSQISFTFYPFIQKRDSLDRYRHYIYTMNSDGSGLAQISTKKDTFGPVWAPDSRRIAYHWRSPDSNHSKILVAEVGSGQETLLTYNDANNILGGWSLDGDKLYFLSNQEGECYEVYVINADGSDQKKLTDTGLNKIELSISPDGTRLLFMGATVRTEQEVDMIGMPDTAYKLFVMNSNGSNLREMPFGEDPPFVRVLYTPTWSPNGDWIAFLGVDPRTIYVIEPDGTNLRQLVQEEKVDQYGEISHPSWSVAGTRIAFRCYGGDICVMNRDGTNVHQLNVHFPGQSPLQWVHQ